MEPEILKKLAKDFLELLGVEVSSLEVNTGHLPAGKAGRTIIAVSSPNSAALIGPNGEHLRALNTILRRLVETKLEGGPPDPARGKEAASFLVDVNGYHEALMERVREGARMLAQRARLFKHDVEMPAMSPYERLVVHELFADDQDIKTESQGEGKFRHIVLKYSSIAAQ